MRSDLAAVAAAFVLQLLVTGTSCFVNVAHTPGQGLQGTATMNKPPHSNGWSADKVVDGNTNQTAFGGSCAIMDFAEGYTSVWLKVQLGRPFNVAYIEIYFRDENNLDRMSGYSIYAFYDDTFDDFASLDPNNLVYHHDPMSGCLPPVQNITINKPARQVVFTIHRTTKFQSSCTDNSNIHTGVEICEIKVMGCDQNKYSSGCESVCSQDCKDQHCDAFNGSCKDCKDGNYILNGVCQECPGHCQNDDFCNKETGKCDNGCKNQWTGHFCNQCSDHFYGSDCNTACGHCSNNGVCDKENGRCQNGCQNNWAGEKCDVCTAGFYGRNCKTHCGHCKDNVVCNKVSGQCPNGCQNQWTGDKCDVCSDHFYGYDCKTSCGFCKSNDICDNMTGHCPRGCQNQWTGDRCDVCSDHFYGTNCDTPCGHCINTDVCDNATGHCPNGCYNHWTGKKCDECSNTFYGSDCDTPCGHCMDNSVCHNMTGMCLNGCQNNWQGRRCDECSERFYGSDCDTACGHCSNNGVCNKENGHCPNGCQSYWAGEKCDDCVSYKYGPNCAFDCGHCKNENQLTTTGVAIIASISTMFAFSLFVIFFMGRYIMKNKTKRHQTDVSVPKNKQPPQTYVDLSVMDDNHGYSSLGSTVPETPYNVIGDSRNNT